LRYLLYGLRVETDRPLPGLRPLTDAGPAELRMWIGAHPPAAEAAAGAPCQVANRSVDGAPVVTVARGGGWYRLRYADGVEFSVDDAGAHVGCTWPGALTLEDAATYLLGPVCGLVLRLRGVTCLHASAVEVDGRAVLLCGPAGAGKSTTAAAFALRGHRVLGDDVAALDATPAGVAVRAAYPHLRLWPDAVRGLFGERAELPPLTPNWDKRMLDLAERDALFHPAPLPVAAVYRLAGREEAGAPRLEALAPAEALLTLVSGTYLEWLPDLGAQARDLATYAALARQAPVRRTVAHADPARLGELCALIEAQVGGGGDA